MYKKFSLCRLPYNPRRYLASCIFRFDQVKIMNHICIGPHGMDVPNLLFFLQICGKKRFLLEGMCCHGLAIQANMQSDVVTSNILINFYSKCGSVNYASEIFNRMIYRDVISFNTMINTYSKHQKYEKAMKLFMQMHCEGLPFTKYTLSSILYSCAAKLALVECRQFHAVALKNAMICNVFVGTALLDVYSKCGMIGDALLVFNLMPERSSVTWSAMISGFVQNNLYEQGLKVYHQAQKLDLEHTQYTLSAALSACSGIAAIVEGAQLHSVTVRTGLDTDAYVLSSLIDVYCRCGHVKTAYLVFQNAEENNPVVWNSMIAGLSRHSSAIEALVLFEKMHQIGLYPNEVTYLSVLSACGHMGLVERAKDIFDFLVQDKNVQINVLHYACMVDVLGRAGRMEEAWDLMCRMPFKATAPMWGSLLSSCRINGHLELADLAAKHLFELEPNNAGSHVLLANIYAANKKWSEVAKARKLLKESGVKKELGKSWIEVQNEVFTFGVGEANHPRVRDVYSQLEEIIKKLEKMNHNPHIESDLHDPVEIEK